jgi:hypothetical protein
MKIQLPLDALLIATSAYATTILTLTPTSGALTAAPGAQVGWGFTLTNPTNFAVITSSNFCLGATGVTSPCTAPTFGTYTDYIANNFTIAGPSPESPSITQSFIPASQTGVGTFLISCTAPIGATNVGQLVLTYDLYSVDPLSSTFDPNADLLSAGNFLADPASIVVAIAPEPSTCALFGAGCLLICNLARRRRNSRPLRHKLCSKIDARFHNR